MLKRKSTTLALVVCAMALGIGFGVVRNAAQRRSVNPLSDLASYPEGDGPSLQSTVRLANFVGELRIVDIKRRGLSKGYSQDMKSFVIDETDPAIKGDEVNLKPEDIRRDDLFTEYEAEVVSVIAGQLQKGDRITLRIVGYAPKDSSDVAKNAASSAPMEMTGDQYLYMLSIKPDGVYMPLDGYLFRMKREEDRLMQTYGNRSEMRDLDGSIITMGLLETALERGFGKGPKVNRVLVSPIDSGMATAQPVAP